MSDPDAVVAAVRAAFTGSTYPGDDFLLGSREGREPYEAIEPFKGRDWQELEPGLLDSHGAALSFFSEAGFRFYLPAFLLADVRGQLASADPLFHLTHGFSDEQVEHQVGARVFVLRTGRRKLVNPLRYGAATFNDVARYRLSVFAREEAAAIVAYLRYKREVAALDPMKVRIDAAVDLFWLERAEQAPTAEDLRRHVAEQNEYFKALHKAMGG